MDTNLTTEPLEGGLPSLVEEIRRSARNPPGWGLSPGGTRFTWKNRVCGDTLTWSIELGEGGVSSLRWEGDACSFCLAGAGWVWEETRGMNLEGLSLYLEEMTQDEPMIRSERWTALRHFPARRGCLLGAIHGLTQWSRSGMSRAETQSDPRGGESPT
jgi:NifU-like protein involved in Fe-S cluster formation